MVDYSKIPGSAFNWDTFMEGSHFSLEPTTHRVWTFTANAAITAGNCVEFAAAGVLNVSTDNSTVAAGIAMETASSGTHCPVLMAGLVRGVTASGAITCGKRIIAGPSGKVKQWGTTNTAADTKIGVSLLTLADADTGIFYINL